MSEEHRPPVSPERVLAVIPARLASTRLPRKVLRELHGKPLLAWVVEAAERCPQIGRLVVAADSPEVAALCAARGWECVMTPPELASGSDRSFAVARLHDADIYINIQADEPMLQPGHISALLAPFADPAVPVTTLKVPCSAESVHDPNVVKVVTARSGRALYFSRAPIPFVRDQHSEACAPRTETHWKHLGLYAYRKAALERFAALAPSPLETMERLEQLRLLENGIDLYVTATTLDTVGVDTEHDLERVAAVLGRAQPS